mgnify:CR=1 FL=1
MEGGAILAASNPFQLGFRDWKQIIGRTARTMGQTDTSLRCAGVAFFSFLSIFPAIAIAVLMLGLFASEAFLTEQIGRASTFLPDIALTVIREQLESLINQPRGGLGIGLAISFSVALWSGSRGVWALVYAASAAHHEKEKRGFIASVALSFAVTVLAALFMIVALALIAAIPIVARMSPVPGTAEQVAMLLRWPALLVLAILGFTLLYRFTLDRHPARLRWTWTGAILASSLWLVTCVAFSTYVENFGEFEASFGSLAAAVVLLLWLYISALIFVLGASLNAEMELQTAKDSTVGPSKPMGERGAYVADNITG